MITVKSQSNGRKQSLSLTVPGNGLSTVTLSAGKFGKINMSIDPPTQPSFVGVKVGDTFRLGGMDLLSSLNDTDWTVISKSVDGNHLVLESVIGTLGLNPA